jgi:hypothetical protein
VVVVRNFREAAMGRRPKDLVQLTLRLREDLRRSIERTAKRDGRSLNEEIVRRIEESFSYGDWREAREKLVAAMTADLASHPNPAATKIAIAKMEEGAERDFQKNVMTELFPTKGSES